MGGSANRPLWRRAGAVWLALAASACMQAGAPPAPARPGAVLGASAGAGALGEWRGRAPGEVEAVFALALARSAASRPLGEVRRGLEAEGFACAVPQQLQGDPPTLICERAQRAGECDHTWQALLYDADRDGAIEATRAFYDRLCAGREGLLGAPPG